MLLQRTADWHAARKGKLTASNVGAALGLCPWTTRRQAFARATGNDKFNGNDATRWGTKNEANGVLAYSAHTGNLVRPTGLHVHNDYPWLAGSPDGLIGEEGLLEVKCPYWRKRDGSRLHKSIPMHYYLQVLLCLECANREWCDFISWAPENYTIFRITRDSDLHEALMPHYTEFYACIARGTEEPSELPSETLEQIRKGVQESMDAHVTSRYERLDIREEEIADPLMFEDAEHPQNFPNHQQCRSGL